MVCTDASQAMIDQCERKCQNGEKNLKFLKSKLPEIPFEENTFDVVMNNFVVHHIVKPIFNEGTKNWSVEDWSPLMDTINNVSKVLKKKGLFIMMYATPEQVSAQWFAHLVPFSHARAKSTYPEKSQINSYFKKAGLKKMFEFMPSSSIIGEKYDDEEIFLKVLSRKY